MDIFTTLTHGTVINPTPAGFGSADWSITATGTSGQADIVITALPSDNGSAIQALQYCIDGTNWFALGGTGTGTYTLTGLTDGAVTTVKLRAVNSNGPGPASIGKPVETYDGSPGSGTEDFTVSYYPTNPIEGEAVVFYITGTSGWSNVSNEYIEIDFKWNFGDPGAVYSLGGGGRDANANYAEGRVVVHTYEGSGPKAIVINAYKADGATAQRTVNLTVQAQSAVSWDRDVYVSQSGNFSGFPAAGGAVSHVSGWNALSNFNFGSNNNCRITLRDDETFPVTLSNTVNIGTSSNLYYIRRSGSGTNPPQVVAGGAANQRLQAFNMGNESARVIFNEVDTDGGWDPVQLTAPNGFMVFCQLNAPAGGSTPAASYHKCTARGLETFHSGKGNASHSGTVYIRMSDCDISDWYNYGAFGHFGGNLVGGTAGCRVAQNTLAINYHDQPVPKAFLVGTAADHGPFRIHYIEYWGNENNTVRSANGWSILGPTSATQPCFRYHTLNTANVRPDWVVNCRRNVCSGDANMVGYGSQSNAKPAIVPGHCIVAGNSMDAGKQNYNGFVSTWGLSGLKAFNNVFVQHNLHEAGNASANRNPGSFMVRSPSSPASAMSAPSHLLFNTFVNLRDTATEPLTQDFQMVRQDGGNPYTGPAFSDINNLIHCPGLGNGGSFPDYTVSPGNDFQLVTGSPNGINAASGGLVPALDFNGVQRSQSGTNTGAHDTEAASVSTPPAPSISSPGISRIVSMGSNPRKYAVTDLGTLNNTQPGIFDIQWRVNGTNVPGGAGPVEVYEDAASGTLTARVGVTNRSGARDTTISGGQSI